MTKKLLITTCIATMLSLTGGAVSLADTGGDFTIYPTYMSEGNRSWIIAKTAPGERLTASVTLENLSAEKQEISLLVREASEEDGRFTVTRENSFKNVGGWITAEGQSYTLDPYSKVRIPITIAVPKGAEERLYTAAVLASKKEPANQNLNIVTEIGVRVYLTVTPKAASYGQTDIFAAPGHKTSFFLYLSSLGLIASILYYAYEKKYA